MSEANRPANEVSRGYQKKLIESKKVAAPAFLEPNAAVLQAPSKSEERSPESQKFNFGDEGKPL